MSTVISAENVTKAYRLGQIGGGTFEKGRFLPAGGPCGAARSRPAY